MSVIVVFVFSDESFVSYHSLTPVVTIYETVNSLNIVLFQGPTTLSD